MPPPIPPNKPQGTIPTTPGLSPADLRNQQSQQRQAQNQQALQDQQKAQQEAEKAIFKRIYNKSIKRGSLIVFQYNFYKHDPFPLCLVGKLWPNGMISGLNLHYLTFRYMKYLTTTFCDKMFHYGMIKGNRFIVNAYRSYKKEGRRQVKVLDCEFLNKVLSVARSFKPSELEAMRQEVQRQLREKMHPTAEQFAKEYQQGVHQQHHTAYDIGKEQPDARFNPTQVQPPEQ